MYARDLPLHRTRSGGLYSKRLNRKQIKAVRKWGRVAIALVLAAAALFAFARAGSRNASGGDGRSRGRPEVARGARLSSLTNLVLVACHAVYTGDDYTKAEDVDSWFLLPYQKVPGQTQSFLQHMQLGVKAAAADPTALLIFSGGQTRAAAGARSEAQSYRNVAAAQDWFGHTGVESRAVTEEHARDSFENLLFSVCRFREVTGRYPAAITVASFEFKHERFAGLHLKALRFPLARFKFLGTPALSEQALQGEAQTVAAFRRDLYGCGAELHEKKAGRDPWHLGPHPAAQCPEMAGLLAFCGPGVYRGRQQLPWEEGGSLRGARSLEHAGN